MTTSREYERSLLRGIARYSNLHGPWAFYTEPLFYRKVESQRDIIVRFKKSGADGIVMREPKRIEEIMSLGLPTVVTPYSKGTIPGLINIVGDELKMGKMAAEHLLERGFQNFAYCGFDDMFWSRNRGKSFANSVIEAGFKIFVYEQPKSYSKRLWENEQNYMVDWLKSLPKPVGLMACNDDRSQHVIDACKIADIHIPEELAVLGVDNDEFICKLANPPLSSIALSTENSAYKAAELLEKAMAGEKISDKIIVDQPTHVVTRQSTDILAIEDHEIAEAIRFIRNNFKKITTVSDIINALTLSRRELERRFRRVLGRSILTEIRRVRVEGIKRMLLETNMAISQIASEFGYSGPEHIARYFHEETGISPQKYRQNFSKR